MLDTVRLRSPSLTAEQAEAVARACVTRVGLAGDTGEELWQFTSGNLAGSYDSKVMVQLCREEWRPSPHGTPVQVECPPYLVVEGSVHKALLGHNVEGGPLDPVAACRWFVGEIGRRLQVELVDALEWQPRRFDWAEVFDLGSYEVVEEWLSWLNLARFPRRQAQRYGDTGWASYGERTGVKAYHKGPDFRKHDYKRIARSEAVSEHILDDGRVLRSQGSRVVELQLRANQLLRLETEVHFRKLQDDLGEQPSLRGVTRQYLEGVHDGEWLRVLREGADEMRTVRTTREVRLRLGEVYDDRLANLLFGTWLQLAALGEREVRKRVPKPTFYRHRAQLQGAGVSWHGADVHVDHVRRLVPEDFSPNRGDPRRLVSEDVAVTSQLEAYRLAS